MEDDFPDQNDEVMEAACLNLADDVVGNHHWHHQKPPPPTLFTWETTKNNTHTLRINQRFRKYLI